MHAELLLLVVYIHATRNHRCEYIHPLAHHANAEEVVGQPAEVVLLALRHHRLEHLASRYHDITTS